MDWKNDQYDFNLISARKRGLEESFAHHTYAMMKSAPAAEYFHSFIKDLAKRIGESFYVSGGPCTGKTVLGSCMVKQVYAEGYHCGAFYIKWKDFLAQKNNPFDPQKVETIEDLSTSVGLLVVDDFGHEDFNPISSGKTLLNLFKERSDKRLSTVVLSPIDLQDLSGDPWPQFLCTHLKAKVTENIQL